MLQAHTCVFRPKKGFSKKDTQMWGGDAAMSVRRIDRFQKEEGRGGAEGEEVVPSAAVGRVKPICLWPSLVVVVVRIEVCGDKTLHTPPVHTHNVTHASPRASGSNTHIGRASENKVWMSFAYVLCALGPVDTNKQPIPYLNVRLCVCTAQEERRQFVHTLH